MEQSLNDAGLLIVSVFFRLITLAVVLRILFQLVRADFYNPLVQLIVRLTQPMVAPLRRVIPSAGGFDTALFVLALAIQLIGICVIISLLGDRLPDPISLFVWSLICLLQQIVDVVFWSIIIVIVAGWLAPHSGHPFLSALRQLVEPVLEPARRIIPPIQGLDLSPIFVFLAIQLFEILVVRVFMGLTGMPALLMAYL